MRSNLELFVLAMIRQGLETPYDFRMKAGLSLGSTVPVLGRLEADGLIKGSAPGLRRSRKYSITGKGAKTLTTEWVHHLRDRPTDIDSVLRIAYLAWSFDGQEVTAKFLRESGDSFRGLSSSRRAEAERLSRSLTASPDVESFLWLRTSGEAMRFEAEAIALAGLAEQVAAKKKKINRPLA